MKAIVATLAVCVGLAAQVANALETASRVLLVTGIDYPGHKWRETTPVLVEALTNDARLRVDVLEDPYRLDTTDLTPYRAVFLHFMNWEKPDPNERAKENLRRFVERGGGMVMIHFACGAFGGWPEFRNLAGRVYDRTNTHDPRGPFTVEIANTNHTIVRGMAPFGVDDELYICLAGEKPIDVLATARSKITKRDHPMAFVHLYGKGRVFQTPLGHDVKALNSGRTLELIRRGTLWAAGVEGGSTTKPDRAEVERTFKVAPGFSIQLIAAEPDIVNPMSIAVDDTGVLWATEAHTYRWGTNGSPFHPPTNPIKRIELGADGRCAKSLVALDGFPEPVIGIAAHQGRIYATCLNELFVCDVATDGKLVNRKALIRDAAKPWNPFGMYRVHVGPDAKLWLCIADHPSSEPVTLTGSDGRCVRLAGQSGGLVRCNLDGSELELIVHGFRAPYAFDIDPWGHIWHISNGEGSPNLYLHVIPGMDYGYASRRASYAWLAGYEPLSPPVRDMGAGANTAALHYYSSMFPREYWGSIFIANWGSHGENPLNREMTRFRRAKENEDRTGTSDSALIEAGRFLTCTDPKFRPTGAALAPDGALYIIDWHGRDDENDKTGRILKIVYSDEFKRAGAAVSNLRSQIPNWRSKELVSGLAHSNHAIRATVHLELAKRGDVVAPMLATVAESGTAFHAAQAIWALARPRSSAAAQALAHGLKHKDGRVRAHALRQLRQAAGQSLAGVQNSSAPVIPLAAVAQMAAPLFDDPDAEVRVEAALAQNDSEAVIAGLLAALQAQPDRRLIYQIGFQLSRHADARTVGALATSARAEERLAALIAIDNARHEHTTLLAELKSRAPQLLAEAPPAAFGEKLVWLRQRDPEALAAEVARLDHGQVPLLTGADRVAALETLVAAPVRNPPVRFLASALDDRDPRVQVAALRAIRSTGSEQPEFCARVLQLAKTAKSGSSRMEAIWTLAALRHGGTTEDWIGFVQDPATRVAAMRALRQRGNSPPVSEALLMRAKSATSSDIAEELLLTLQVLGASQNQCSEAGLDLPSRERSVLASSILQRVPKASPAQGQLSFHSPRVSCSKCHATRHDEPSLGPNLSNIGAAAQPEYLVESILEPSKVIKTGFETERIETSDGQSAMGLVELRGDKLIVRVSAEERMTLSRDQIRSRSVTALSSMPEGLDAACSTAELADIVAFLMSLRSGGN